MNDLNDHKNKLMAYLPSTADPTAWKPVYHSADQHNAMALLWIDKIQKYKKEAESRSYICSLVLESAEFWEKQIQLLEGLMVDHNEIHDEEKAVRMLFKLVKPTPRPPVDDSGLVTMRLISAVSLHIIAWAVLLVSCL